MVQNQAYGCHQGKTRTNPEGVGDAPNYLPDKLGMSGNPDNSGFVEMYLGLLDGGNFQQVEGGGIEKQKGNGR
jgi:hypothetical protein